MKNTGLGKGLSAVFSKNSISEFEKNIDTSKYKVEMIEFDLVKPNKSQPRKNFDAESLESLAQSIKRNGIIQPILVRKLDMGYEIIAGERRYRASRIAGLKNLPCIVIEGSDIKRYEMSLVENIHRQQLSPLEEANAYKYLLEDYNITQQEMSQITGKSRTYISNMLRLLGLEEPVRELLEEKKITIGHGKELLKLKGDDQIQLAKKVAQQDLSVRDLEKLIHLQKDSPAVKKKEKVQDAKMSPEVKAIKESLMEKLGTKVNFKMAGKEEWKGKIEIEFFSQEEFDRIVDLITTGE